jgi:hypothetical protein
VAASADQDQLGIGEFGLKMCPVSVVLQLLRHCAGGISDHSVI